MATLILVTEPDNDGTRRLLHAEGVVPAHLDDRHAALQLVERLGWAIGDGRAEAGEPPELEPGSWPLPSGL